MLSIAPGSFTTYEKIEVTLPHVIKKDGLHVAFDRRRIFDGISKACEKRPVSIDDIEAAVDRIEALFQDSVESEVPTSVIGEAVMDELRNARRGRLCKVRFRLQGVSRY